MTQPLSLSPRFAAPSVEVLARHLESELSLLDQEGFVSVPLAAPDCALCRVLEVLGETQDRFVWAPAEGPSWIGAGTAAELAPREGDSIGALRERGVARLASTRVRAAEPLSGEMEELLRPRLFGGLAFSPGSVGEAWRDLGEGRFVLPRWLYARGSAGAALVLTLSREQSAEASSWARRAVDLLGGLAAGPLGARDGSSGAELEAAGSWRELRDEARSFTDNVERILGAIRAGSFEKIVAARCRVLELDGELELGRAIERLSESAHESTRFAFARGGSLFFGATPECLVRTSGRHVESEALAGTIALEEGAEAADRLRESTKDLHEHSLVVRHLVERLRPICTELSWPEAPRVRELRNLIHLDTPVRGVLDRPRHVLELVERLHPTPAVGGVPVETAVAWIEDAEPTPRGWYSGPIGWFDAAGGGDFAVALRSCLVQEGRAHLFAGSGIVDDSRPEAELEETRVKQRSMQEALRGAVVARPTPAR